jgi:hypothetical protein
MAQNNPTEFHISAKVKFFAHFEGNPAIAKVTYCFFCKNCIQQRFRARPRDEDLRPPTGKVGKKTP